MVERVTMAKGGMPPRNKKNFRPTKKGAGMTKAGVAAYRRANPGSKLKTAVTGKVKLFFEMFSQLPSWFTNLWILVVASIYGIKGTQIFRNGGKK